MDGLLQQQTVDAIKIIREQEAVVFQNKWKPYKGHEVTVVKYNPKV